MCVNMKRIILLTLYFAVVRLSKKSTRAMNMGSYNYLGFAQNSGECADKAERAVHRCGLDVCSSRHELGMFGGSS